MLGSLLRGRKPEQGFEWHKYVRTTIKLRREARREKAERLKQQASDGVKAAGAAAAQGAKVAGAAAAQGAKAAGSAAAQGAKLAGAAAAGGAKVAGAAAGVAAREGARNLGAGSRVAAAGLGRASRAGAALAGTGLGLVGERMITLLRPLLDVLGRPSVAGPLMFAGIIAVLGGVARPLIIRVFDTEAAIAIGVGLGCLLLSLLPRILLGNDVAGLGPFARLSAKGRNVLAGGLVALSIGLLAVKFGPGLPPMPSLPSFAKLPSLPFAAPQFIEGRATITGADLLRIGNTTVRLGEIELPDREQVCVRPGNKRWRCGEAAAAVVSRLTNGRTLKCEVKGPDSNSIFSGVCFDGTADINAALVKGGHVFSAGGLLPRYGSQESEARQAKAGVWGAAGNPERPKEWRNRMWEEAKKRAPTGCPIKGQVTGNARTYVLPWAPEYERVRVNEARGGRWFCSEDEAISAGWKVAGR